MEFFQQIRLIYRLSDGSYTFQLPRKSLLPGGVNVFQLTGQARVQAERELRERFTPGGGNRTVSVVSGV